MVNFSIYLNRRVYVMVCTFFFFFDRYFLTTYCNTNIYVLLLENWYSCEHNYYIVLTSNSQTDLSRFRWARISGCSFSRVMVLMTMQHSYRSNVLIGTLPYVTSASCFSLTFDVLGIVSADDTFRYICTFYLF